MKQKLWHCYRPNPDGSLPEVALCGHVDQKPDQPVLEVAGGKRCPTCLKIHRPPDSPAYRKAA